MTQHEFFNYLINKGYTLSNCPNDTTFKFTKGISTVILTGQSIESKPDPGTSKSCTLSSVSIKNGTLVYPKSSFEDLL